MDGFSRRHPARAREIIESHYVNHVDMHFGCQVTGIQVHTGALTVASADSGASTRRFDLIVGADGAGSVVRRAMQEQVAGFWTGIAPLVLLCRIEGGADPSIG